MQTRVVLVFDDLAPTHEALRYSVELAHRMGSTLVLLMLLSRDVMDRSRVGDDGGSCRPEDAVEDLFAPCIASAETADLPVEKQLRIGHPPSEFMKFLAEIQPVHAIVWGGDGECVRRKPRTGKVHWFARIRDGVELPVVVPRLKT